MPPFLGLLVRPSQKPTVLRLHKPRHHHPGLQRIYRHHDHGHPAAAAHPRQTLPLPENRPLRRLLPGNLRHPLLHPLKGLLHLQALRHGMARLVRPRGRNRRHRRQYPADLDAVPSSVSLEFLPPPLLLQ